MPQKQAGVEPPAIDAATLSRAIISRQPSVSGIRLIKLAYLAEVRYLEHTGKRLSTARWFVWKHGPFSKEVVNSARDQPETVVIHSERSVMGKTAHFYTAGPECAPDIPREIGAFLDDIIETYGQFDTQAIISAAYRTGPFFNLPSGRSISFSSWRNRVAGFRSSPEVRAHIQRGLEGERFPFSDVEELTELLANLRVPDDASRPAPRSH